MEAVTWKVYQIYYDAESYTNTYIHPNVIAYFNSQLTDYFENSVILDLYKEADKYDYFGVWSHLHRQKVQGSGWDIKKLSSGLTVDVLAFQRFLRNGRIFSGEQEKIYGKIFNNLMESLKLKYRFPVVPKFVVMQNHFICRGFIFKDYVETVLKPGIKLIEEIPEAGQVIKYEGKAERYTYKPFLCEKLFTAYLHEKKYTCEQW